MSRAGHVHATLATKVVTQTASILVTLIATFQNENSESTSAAAIAIHLAILLVCVLMYMYLHVATQSPFIISAPMYQVRK